MRTEVKVKELNDELRALKAVYERNASEIIVYATTIRPPSTGYVSYTVEFLTDDGSNAIAVLENAEAKRVPFEGGAKWVTNRIYWSPLRVRSMQKGTLRIV